MRYIIGIDLGTTNSCVSYVDTQDAQLSLHSLKIPQLVAPGSIEACPTLPSFCYLSSPDEWPKSALMLPWNRSSGTFVGLLAMKQGAKVPTKVVQSAKSWLCHAASNRKDKILPVEGDLDKKISPIEATAQFLNHIKEAWNYLFATNDPLSEFEQQEIILTVPASFDEVARRLTAEAAKLAGYAHMTLLEEPQAAFYSWISQHANQWQQLLKEGDSILVVDVGGGTTDLSLIEVGQSENKLIFNRKAVGDHLLLGGDNMDAMLAHYAEKKLCQENEKKELHMHQWLLLKHQVRQAKEALLSNPESSKPYPILIQGTGSSILKGSLSIQLESKEIVDLLINGFFGDYEWEEALKLRKSSGFRTMGLPYEEEASITKHLAAFLQRSQFQQAPNYILFNGGAMKPSIFQQSILQSLKNWFPGSQTKILASFSLDLAVARGAAYYGKVRRGLGVRIGGGLPKAYYLGVDIKNSEGNISHQALTLLPRGAEEGANFEYPNLFFLRPNTHVSFTLYTSHVRLQDSTGDLIPIDPKELQPLPPIHTILRLGKNQVDNVPVRLLIRLTAIGTLELWLQSQKTEHRWSLEFQLKTVSGHENALSGLNQPRTDESFDADVIQMAIHHIHQSFLEPLKASKMMETLEGLLNRPRREWSVSVLRSLFDAILDIEKNRKIHPALFERWWNAIGFFLRPGFGYPLDDFRIKELWKIFLAVSKTSRSSETLIQEWICFRRIAGGLNKGQQTQIAHEMLATLLPNKSTKIILNNKSALYPYSEKMRALASFELLEIPQKIRIGQALLSRILAGEAIPSDYWSLGRIGARHLVYGSAANIIPQEQCGAWIKALLKMAPTELLMQLFAQLARKTDQREFSLPQAMVDDVISLFVHTSHHERFQELLSHSTHLTAKEQEHVFGDHLPAGLILNPN